MSDMDYIELAGAMKSWSPHSYGWKCVSCTGYPVYILDGDIDPREKTWERKRREFERKELFATIGAIGFKKERTREQICSRVQDGRNQPQSAEVDVKDHLNEDTPSA